MVREIQILCKDDRILSRADENLKKKKRTTEGSWESQNSAKKGSLVLIFSRYRPHSLSRFFSGMKKKGHKMATKKKSLHSIHFARHIRCGCDLLYLE